MKIYIVSVWWGYDGIQTMGVHGNLEDANRQRSELLTDTYGDYVEVHEWELGQTKKEPWDKGGIEI